MENLIDNVEILLTVQDIKQSKKFNTSYEEMFNSFPDVVQQIYKTDKGIAPKHCTHQLLRSLFISGCKKIEPKFKVDANCETAIDMIIKYIRKDPSFITMKKGLSFDKGIILRGGVGCGKTLMMKGLASLLKAFEYFDYDKRETIKISFDIFPSYRIVEEFCKRGFEYCDVIGNMVDFSKLKSTSPICIDDLGCEGIASYYGNTSNIIGNILMTRYNMFKEKKNIITHATSNLDKKNLVAFYGERVVSRVKEMFNDIVLPGEDRRH